MMTSSLDDLFLSLLRLNPDPVAQQTTLADLSAAEGEALVAKAKDQRVVGLVYQALQALPEGTVPEAVLSPLRAVSQQVAQFNLALVRELKAILSTLNAATIPVIVLKGSHLAQSVYPQLHLRQMGDIDLLVPQERVVEAYDLVKSLGYKTYRDDLDDVVGVPAVLVSQNHGPHLTPLRKAPELPCVELHWTLCDTDEAADFNLEEIWQRSVPTTFLGEPARVLAPEDLILHLCHHAAYHHRFDMGVQGAVDISRVVDRFQSQIDWNALQRTAEAWGWQRGVYLTLALTEAMIGLPLPDQMAQTIQTAMPSPGFVAQTQALLLESKATRQTLAQVLSQEAADRALWLNLIQRLGRILRRTFPSPQRMADLYNVAPSYWDLHLYYYYWRRLRAYGTYKTAALAGRRRDRQAWQMIEADQPAMIHHADHLHQWLTSD